MKPNFTPEVKKQLDDLLKTWIKESEEDFLKNDKDEESEVAIEEIEETKLDDS